MRMATDDALQAAKLAALQALNANPEDGAATNANKRRRRKRKRSSKKPDGEGEGRRVNGGEENKIAVDISDEEGASNGVSSQIEYQPESLAGVIKRARVLSEHDAEEIMKIASRFEQREAPSQPLSSELEADAKVKLNGSEAEKQKGAGSGGEDSEKGNQTDKKNDEANADKNNDDDDDSDDDDEDGKQRKGSGISRKKWKEERRNMISRLKGIVPDPSVVEAWDITANDPVLLATLKCVRNSVSVPANWRQKRKYLQNKRGLEKRTVNLPHYIEQLGIGGLRDAQRDADGKKTLKQKQREKMRAKLNLSLLSTSGGPNDQNVMEDEQRLHDAFFKYQTKPRLTTLGDLYYELRELQVDHSHFKPGVLSQPLRDALGGLQSNDPPPWLIGMQRWGPPPSYPGLKIPGLNFPIPPGKSFGFGPGQFGKPPVDVNGRPLYGDVFAEGLVFDRRDKRFDISDSQKTWLWGRPRNDLDYHEPEPEKQDTATGDDKEDEIDGKSTRKDSDATANQPSHPSSRPTNTATATATAPTNDRDQAQAQAYRVLPERRSTVGASNMLGSSHVYDMNATDSDNARQRTNYDDEITRVNHATSRQHQHQQPFNNNVANRRNTNRNRADDDHAEQRKGFKF